MRAGRPFLTTGLAFLFFAEGQRAFFGSLFGLAYDAVFPVLNPGAVLLALLPLLALLAPFVPLARRFDRDGAVAIALAGIAIFRLPLSVPEFGVRTLSAALVVGCGALFLTWAVGHLEGRALAGGVIAGLVADQLLLLGGASWDPSLRPGWLPVQAVLSLLLLFLVLAPGRARGNAETDGATAGRTASHPPGGDQPVDGEEVLERRSGGLRLRGGLALGALLFLDLHILGLPPVISRWTGASYEMCALAIAVAGGLALGIVLSAPGPVRSRFLALGLVGMIAAALIAGPLVLGAGGAVLLAAGHAAALLLVARSLAPASGRRGGAVVAAGMLLFVLLTALYAATFFSAFLLPLLEGAAPWVLGAAVVVVGGVFFLLPRPPVLSGRLSPLAGAAAGLAVVAIAVVLVVFVLPPARAPVPTSAAATGEGPGAPGSSVRVATYNIHYGYDEDWRFDPEAIAAAVGSVDPDLVALQEVPVGMPTAYGVDFPLWLGRRLGIPAFFSANTNRLQGEAILSRLPTRLVRSWPLPPPESDRKQVLHLAAVVGGRTVDFYALHLSVHEAERIIQLATALDFITPGRSVVLGDLNAEPDGPVVTTLRAAGFVDAFEAAGAEPAPTWPAGQPEIRIDWLWLRGVDATDARVLDADPSDHRLVIATLQVEPPRR